LVEKEEAAWPWRRTKALRVSPSRSTWNCPALPCPLAAIPRRAVRLHPLAVHPSTRIEIRTSIRSRGRVGRRSARGQASLTRGVGAARIARRTVRWPPAGPRTDGSERAGHDLVRGWRHRVVSAVPGTGWREGRPSDCRTQARSEATHSCSLDDGVVRRREGARDDDRARGIV